MVEYLENFNVNILLLSNYINLIAVLSSVGYITCTNMLRILRKARVES